MKAIFFKYTALFSLLTFFAGCEPSSDISPPDQLNGQISYSEYAPVKIELMPLTELVNTQEESKIKAYVSMLDKLGSQVKFPAVFRFELYEKLAYSGQPKGKRLIMWPDMDLKPIDQNSRFWQDTFRAYNFDLDFDFPHDRRYLLQVTCMLPDGQRLTAGYEL